MFTRKAFLPFVFTMFFAIVLIICSKQVASFPLAQSESRLFPTNFEELPFLETESTNDQFFSMANVSARLSWSKVVFQSYRDGNWNIYKGDDDGKNQVKLTSNSGSDIHPDFNRGTSKIVYASWRDSDYEIFVMNSDGSGQKSLTANQANDVNPKWSPDGTKIIYESYVNGEADIYIMNADGSNPKRLTTSSAYDGMPAWSPDGSQIAFVSQRTGVNRIWKMDINGGNSQQLSQTPSSVFPAWSPDGSQIAFSADGNNNGWLEIWVMDADGTNEHKVKNTSNNRDLWVRGWSPDNGYITYTDISFVQYKGNWYWTKALLAGVFINNGYTIQLSDNQFDWYPHWQTNDDKKPAGFIQSLPDFLPDNSTISWSGYDTGGAGLLGYDVEYRNISSQNWTEWQSKSTLTEAKFHDTSGESYVFRMRACDTAYNCSNWQITNATTLFTWGITGQVTDNAGTPIEAANIDTIPDSFFGDQSLENGNYETYLGAASDSYQVSWSKTGYGSLQTSDFPAVPTAAEVNIVLPPVDDIVVDGKIESDNLAAWETSGLFLPIQTSDVVHTGDNSVRLGQASPTIPPLDWDTLTDMGGRLPTAFLATPNNNLHAVWSTYENDGADVYHIMRNSDGSWSTPYNISNDTEESNNEHFAVDNNNGVHVVWHRTHSIFYSSRNENGDWSEPTNLSSELTTNNRSPSIIVSDNKVHVVWFRGGTNSLHYRWRHINGDWSEPLTIAADLDSGKLKLLVDMSDTLHLMWGQRGNTDEGFYWQKPVNADWSATEEIPVKPGMGHSDMKVADNGEVHFLTWRTGGPEIYYSHRSLSGKWSSPYLVTAQKTQHFFTKFVVTADNKVHVIWTVNPNMPDHSTYGLYYALRSSNGTWSGTQKLTDFVEKHESSSMFWTDGNGGAHLLFNMENDSYYARVSAAGEWSDVAQITSFGDQVIATNMDNTIHLISREYGQRDLRYSSFSFPDGDSKFSQTLFVPQELNSPRLSFMYHNPGLSGSDNTGLEVLVDDGTTLTEIASIEESNTQWSHASEDLTPWLGKAITLTFSTPQFGDSPPFSVYLDNISIGSSYPDVWVNGEGTMAALNGAEVNYLLQYGNRGGAAASETQITLDLSTDLTFVSAIPQPTNINGSILEWDLGELAPDSKSSIEIIATVDSGAIPLANLISTVGIESTGMELESLNNDFPFVTFVGELIYLPALFR